MKYRIYYLDQPGTEDMIIEAPDHEAAAKQFFSQRPRNERCWIRVETKGFMQYRVRDYDAVEFMDESTRASLSPVPPPETSSAGMPARAPRPEEIRVVITDIEMRFSSMVIFMVKWVFAAIPAIIIIYFIIMIVIALGVGFFSHK